MSPAAAFLSPEAKPTSDVTTGARQLARLTITALRRAGYDVRMAARFEPGPAPDARVRTLAEKLARRAGRRLNALDAAHRPQVLVGLTVRGGAPDLIGPVLAARAKLPYIAFEAGRGSPSPDAIALPAFTDTGQFATGVPGDIPADMRVALRGMVGGGLGLDPETPWIMTAAMMTEGNHVASYRELAAALSGILDRPWQLVVAGDGARRQAVAEALFPLGPERIRLAGTLRGGDLAALYRAADIFAWPATGARLAMACLEAQSAGLPVVAGAETVAATFVRDRETGLLAPGGEATAFAEAIARLLDDAEGARTMGRAAQARMARHHDMANAVGIIGAALSRATMPGAGR